MSLDATRAIPSIAQPFLDVASLALQAQAQAAGPIARQDLEAAVANADGSLSEQEIGAAQILLDRQASRDTAAQDTAAQNQDLLDAIEQLPDDLQTMTAVRATVALIGHRSDPDALAAITDLAASEAFRTLDSSQQNQALVFFGGTTEMSGAARDRLGGIDLADPGALQEYLLTEARPADLWREVQPDSGFPDHARKDYGISGPEDITHQFPSRTQPDAEETLGAWRYTVHVDGQSIEVIVPKHSDRDTSVYSYPSLPMIAQALAAQPSVSLEATDRVVLLPGYPQTTDDQGNVVDRTALMWAGNGTITVNLRSASNPYEQKNVDYTFLHETAHLVEQPWQGDFPLFKPGWNDAVDADRLFPTGYATDNYVPNSKNNGVISRKPTEDFAEAYMIYHAVKGTPDEARMRALMPARFEILDQMFP